MWKDEWYITIKDIMRGTLFDVRVDTISEAIRILDKYNNDSDYEIVTIHRIVTEVHVVDIKSFNIEKYKRDQENNKS